MDKIKSSNRTTQHKGFVPRLDRKHIDFICEKLGYTSYLPEVLLHDLINIYTFLSIEGCIEGAFNEETPDELVEFFNSLSYDFFIGENPIELAIDTLKELTLNYNLRVLNEGAVERVLTLNDNCVFTMDDRDKILIQDKDLDIDYSKIMRLGLKLRLELKLKSTNGKDKTRRMSSYSDVTKVSKSELLRPDFTLKLATKSFSIKESISESEQEVLVLVEDCSESMGKGDGYNLVKAIQRELCNDVRTIHYYRHHGYSTTLTVLRDREDKLNKFSEEVVHHNYVLDYKTLYKELEIYSKGDVIIITDGRDFVPDYKGKLNLYFICLEDDSRINNICKSSGGKMIVV